MHIYEPRWAADGSDEPPSIAAFRFRSALDVVAYAQHWCCIGRYTWPEVWHLDDDGSVVSHFRGSSLDSIRQWATNPAPLLAPPPLPPRTDVAGERWLIVDSRPAWRCQQLGEHDAAAFVALRDHLRAQAVDLVDTVVFDDACRWWSLHELTTGRVEWDI